MLSTKGTASQVMEGNSAFCNQGGGTTSVVARHGTKTGLGSKSLSEKLAF